MKNICWIWSSLFVLCCVLTGCVESRDDGVFYETPTVDYVERLNVNDAPHQESFLNQLAMNYRSYALYNARTSGYPEVGELFAQKAVGAFSGETPFPESLDNWRIPDESQRFEIYTAYNDLMNELRNDAVAFQPQLAAEAQAKFDCWISAASTGQDATAQECEDRFMATMDALRNCDRGQSVTSTQNYAQNYVRSGNVAGGVSGTRNSKPVVEEQYYPETRRLSAVSGMSRSRDGIMIVNNVNVPSSLIQPVPVPVSAPQKQSPTPIVFNQNIYGGEENVDIDDAGDTFNNSEDNSNSCGKCFSAPVEERETSACNRCQEEVRIRQDDGYVTREEFIDLMLALRSELAAINARLDDMENRPVPTETDNRPIVVTASASTVVPAPEKTPTPAVVPARKPEKTIIKVQQIPLEPRQRIMEEIFEIRFDFDKATIKPEYENIIRQLAATTQANKNIKVSVVGHTDTAGSSAYNYALGGRRAEAVQKMLIEYGIPASQIIAVSAGEEDLKVPTPDNTPNAANRRVRVVKETPYTEQIKPAPVIVEEYTEMDGCNECGSAE